MRNTLSEIEKIELLRPVSNEHIKDRHSIPIMQPVTLDMLDWENLFPINIQNLSSHSNNSQSIVFFFRNDTAMRKYWLHPVKYVPLLQTAALVATPDFSVDPNMDYEELRHMVYQSRWLGCFWQDRGVPAIPTIVWETSRTYDLCFDSLPNNSVVALSTIGVKDNLSVFIAGYIEMMKRISPQLIIVYGDMIDGMWGRFINFPYAQCHRRSPHHQQLQLELKYSKIFEIRRCSNGQSRIIC